MREVLALAPLSPSPSCGQGSDRDKSQMHGHTSVFTQWTAGSAAEVENCLTRSFPNDATLQKILKKEKLIVSHFITPVEVFSFIFYTVGQNKGSVPPTENYWVRNWTQ